MDPFSDLNEPHCFTSIFVGQLTKPFIDHSMFTVRDLLTRSKSLMGKRRIWKVSLNSALLHNRSISGTYNSCLMTSMTVGWVGTVISNIQSNGKFSLQVRLPMFIQM